MADVITLRGAHGACLLRADDLAAQLVFHPTGEEAYLQPGEGFAAELQRAVEARIGRVLTITVRGALEPLAIEDLSVFAAPILWERQR